MTVLRLQIDVVATEDGGRQGPIFDGYHGAISFGETSADGLPVVHDTFLVFESADRVAPGESATARAWVMAPDYLPDLIGPGKTFKYVEGHRTVARARVLEVRTDATAFPIHDVQDAKRRRLDPP
jgi:translation elongation factor EF-Tu-like GTPase